MSEYDELVKRLRDGFITMECDDGVVRYSNHVAADAIEALVGENARLNALIGPSLEAAISPLRKYISELQDVNKAAEAEVERLKGALKKIADHGDGAGCNPRWLTDIARKALEAKP